MFKAGDKNAELEQVWANMPENAGKKDVLPKRVDASKLLPHNHDYYRLNGSLTTPPVLKGAGGW